MPILGRRRLNGVPMAAIPANGVAPSVVSDVALGSIMTTTIGITYGSATGTSSIVYAGWTSPHSSSNWTKNAGSFGGAGGTFINLSPATNYDLRIIATNSFGSSVTDALGGVSTLSLPATSFSVTLNRASGVAGATVTMTVTPLNGLWPTGSLIVPSSTGLAGTFDNSSLPGNGSSPVTFAFNSSSGPGTSGTLNAATSGMVNSSGAQAYSITLVASNTTANRFDIIAGSSSIAMGSPVQITLYPNANFPSGTVVLSGTNGSFSPGPTITLSRGTTAPIAVTYTPATAGEHTISSSNTAGLYNPYPAPLTVFSSSSGTSQTIAASLTRADMVTFQRDSASGNPTGFSLPWARGWGEVWLNLTSVGGASNGLWIRLYDAMSSGASTVVASGAALHSAPIQVYGAVNGSGVVRVLLPAGPYIYYADLATDAAFTRPVRVAQRFRVGVVFGHFSRSQESGLSRAYAYSGIVPLPTNYTKTATWVGFDYRYPDVDSGWFVHDGITVDPYQYHYSESSSSGAQEIGRLVESQLGVCVGIAGSSATGGGLDNMVNHDGSLTGGFTGSVASAVGSKFRYLWMATGNWDGVDTVNYPTETQGEDRTRFIAAVDWIAKNYPACAVIGWVSSASGVFGNNGSSLLGYTRTQSILMNELEPVNPVLVSKECYNWNEFMTNHSTMAARVQYVRAGFRMIMAAEVAIQGGFQSLNRGPRLSSSGSIKSGSRVISIPYSLAGGSALQAVGVNCTNPTFTVNSASNSELASLFSVYQAGGYQGNGTAINIDTASINSSSGTIDLVLSGSAGITFADNTTAPTPNGFSVHYAADFTASNNSVPLGQGRAVMITDDRIDSANGIPHGWHMRPAVDISISTV